MSLRLLVFLYSTSVFAQLVIGGSGGGGGSSNPGNNPYSCTVSATAGPLACNHGLGTTTPWVSCYDGAGNLLGSTGASTSVTSVVATSSNIATITFSGVTSGVCSITTGGVGPQGATGSTGGTGPSVTYRIAGYEVGTENGIALVTGDLTSHGILNNDLNTKTLTEIMCLSDAGSQTVLVKINGGANVMTMVCVNPINYGTTDGTTGYAVAGNMTTSTITSHQQLDLSGTANTTTKNIKLQIWGHQ
jgi:hypothetical protein